MTYTKEELEVYLSALEDHTGKCHDQKKRVKKLIKQADESGIVTVADDDLSGPGSNPGSPPPPPPPHP